MTTVDVVIGGIDTNTAGKLVFIYYEEGNTGRHWSEEELKFKEE